MPRRRVDRADRATRRAAIPSGGPNRDDPGDDRAHRRILLDQYHGGLEHALRRTIADLERHRLAARPSAIAACCNRADLGLHLTSPWRVVVAGPPNVGKSSLINALVGYHRAVVFDTPGTTRDVVTVGTAIDGWPVELSDTAGIRPSDDRLESRVGRAIEQTRQADLVALGRRCHAADPDASPAASQGPAGRLVGLQ